MWLFLIILPVVDCLTCYKSYQLIPAKEEVTDNTTKTTNYSYGFCVTIRMHNSTHKVAERNFWRAALLPLECHYYKSHCFPLKSSKWQISGCCCSEDLCNDSEDALYMHYPMIFNPTWWNRGLILSRAFLLFVASQTVPVWVTILGTISVYWLIKRVQGKPPDEEDHTPEEAPLLVKAEPSLTLSCPSQRPPMRQNLTQRQLSPGNKATKTKIKKIPKKKSAPSKTPLKTPARLETNLDSTQPSEKKIRSPIKGIQQAKPKEEIVLPNGRIQKISMNFEEGDDEWEEEERGKGSKT